MDGSQEHQGHLHGLGMFHPHPPGRSSDHRLSQPLSPRTRLPPIKNIPVIKQKCHFSELISMAAGPQVQAYLQGPKTEQSLLCQAGYVPNTPKASTFQTPKDLRKLFEKDIHGPSTQLLLETDFPGEGYTAKVQVPFSCLPGQCPRKIEIERRRRKFLDLDIAELLGDHGIDSNLLMTRVQGSRDPHISLRNPSPPISNYLPLETANSTTSKSRDARNWKRKGFRFWLQRGG